MIGGVDVVMKSGVPIGEALDVCVRSIMRAWPKAVVENADSGRAFDKYSHIAFRSATSIFVYKDEAARQSWDALGADPGNANTLLHVLASSETVTVVVDDSDAAEIKAVLDRIRASLRDKSLLRGWRLAA